MRKPRKTKIIPGPEDREARIAYLKEQLVELDKRDAEVERRRVENDERMRVYREQNRIEFFEPIRTVICKKCEIKMAYDWDRLYKGDIFAWQCPNCHHRKDDSPPYQVKILEYLHAGKKTITLQGANRIGKTTIGAVIVSAACLGIQPWDQKIFPPPLDKPPIKVRILCEDWEDHAKGVIVPELKNWLPVGQYGTPQKNNVGVEAFWPFKNGSTIELMTNRQDTRQHESWKGHIVWSDEPTEYDKYVANMRGLIDYGGIFLLTMTAVKASWVLDEIILNPHPSFASVTEIPIEANPHLSEEKIERFAASIRESDKIARLKGGWLNLTGLVWPGFKPDVHIIDPFEIPTDWPVVPLVDHHPSHPNAIGYYAVDPFGRIFVIDETYGHMSPEQEGDDIIRHKISNAWRISDVFIDPLSKGDTNYIKNRGLEIDDTYTVLKERLWKHGIDLHVATKDKASGIRNVEKMLEGPNKTPTLFFFRSLNKIEKEGHIWEIRRWTYDDNNKPKDENDHFMENLYRMTLTGVKYTPLRRSGDNLKSETEFQVFQPNYGIQEESQTEFNVWR